MKDVAKFENNISMNQLSQEQLESIHQDNVETS